jgi:hypothetical protein
MTMPRYNALQHYWEDYPPADFLVAAYFKAGAFSKKGKRRSAKAPMDGRQYDHRGFPLRPDGTMLPPTLDEKPGTLQDMARVLKMSGKKTVAF